MSLSSFLERHNGGPGKDFSYDVRVLKRKLLLAISSKDDLMVLLTTL